MRRAIFAILIFVVLISMIGCTQKNTSKELSEEESSFVEITTTTRIATTVSTTSQTANTTQTTKKTAASSAKATTEQVQPQEEPNEAELYEKMLQEIDLEDERYAEAVKKIEKKREPSVTVKLEQSEKMRVQNNEPVLLSVNEYERLMKNLSSELANLRALTRKYNEPNNYNPQKFQQASNMLRQKEIEYGRYKTLKNAAKIRDDAIEAEKRIEQDLKKELETYEKNIQAIRDRYGFDE